MSKKIPPAPDPKTSPKKRGPRPKDSGLLYRNVPHTEQADRAAEAQALAEQYGVSVAVVWRFASDLDRARERLESTRAMAVALSGGPAPSPGGGGKGKRRVGGEANDRDRTGDLRFTKPRARHDQNPSAKAA
jgi:hypothetical protein